MKITIVTDTSIDRGGPVNRLIGILPYLSVNCIIEIISLGPINRTFFDLSKKLNITVYSIPFSFNGWFVNRLYETSKEITDIASENHSDILLLGWEIWDLVDALSKLCWKMKICFATLFHGVPFAGTLPNPSKCFYIDVFRRAITHRKVHVAKYLFLRIHSIRNVLKRVKIISLAPITTELFLSYFSNLKVYEISPAYSVDFPSIIEFSAAQKKYDLSFMASLYKEKGIFDLLRIIRIVRKSKPDVKVIVIGKFPYKEDKKRFLKIAVKHSIINNIKLINWIDGKEKYKFLSSSRVFTYPSTADTFSISLVEALACGLPAVCYDVPFVNSSHYSCSSIIKVGYRNLVDFSNAALLFLKNDNYKKYETVSKKYVKGKYGSWIRVAESEVRTYNNILKDYGKRKAN